MKILELRSGNNIAQKRLKIVGVLKPFEGSIYLNNEPLILNKVSNTTFPIVSLDHLRDFTTKEEMYYAYKLYKPQLIREGSNITSSQKALLVVEETDEEWDNLDVLIIQFQVKADANGKIRFQESLTAFGREDVGDVFYLNKIIFIPEKPVKLTRFNLFNWDMVTDELILPDVPIPHLVPWLFVAANTQTVIWGETESRATITIIFEMVRDRFGVYSEKIFEDMMKVYEKSIR